MATSVRATVIVLASVLLGIGLPTPSRAADPLAIVSAVKGKVEVASSRSKQPQRASFGLPLQKGDRVVVGRGGTATIFFSDGNVIELGEQSSVTIGARVEHAAKAEIAGEVFTQVSSFVTGGSRQTGLVALSSMRGVDTPAFLLSPRRTSILETKPTFLWQRVPGATRYVIKVSTADSALWTRETADTTLSYPPDAASLPADADILWEVEARAASGSLRHESTFLHVLSVASGAEVKKRVDAIDVSLGKDSAAAQFLAGSYLSASGLHQDAIDRFTALCRASPNAPGPHEALGRAYASVGLVDLATTEYERALELSRAP